MQDGQGGFPISSKQLTVEVEGKPTDLLVCSYEDYVMVVATQLGTFGTMLEARQVCHLGLSTCDQDRLPVGKPCLVGSDCQGLCLLWQSASHRAPARDMQALTAANQQPSSQQADIASCTCH